MKKRLFLVITSLLFLGQGAWAEATVSFVESDTEKGTANSPFLIESIGDLETLASDVNSGTDYSGKYFELTKPLTSENDFTPIGIINEEESVYKPFRGIFIGGGNTISGLIINKPNDQGVGLFGYIHSPARIENLKITSSSITGNYMVGAIVGCYMGYAQDENVGIFDCEVSNDVSVKANTIDELTGSKVGGIAGYMEYGATISNCTSLAIVSGDEYVGGIVGQVYGGDDPNTYKPCIITDIYYDADCENSIGFYESKDVTFNISLLDNDIESAVKNATRIANYNGETCDVTLSGRTLYKDGGWNTLCLPFDLTAEQLADDDCPLYGATLKTLSSSSFANNTLTLTFTDASSIEADTPYLIKWSDFNDNVTGPTFTGVTINNTAASKTETTNIDFIGCYSPFAMTADNTKTLYMGAEDCLYYPAIKSFVLNFDEESGSTGISEINEDAASVAGWFTMDGRRLSDEPVQKGMYIRYGRKVMVK